MYLYKKNMENQALNGLTNPIESIEFALKGLGMRSKAIAGNIANINTPGYKRKTVNFEDILQEKTKNDIAISSTNDNHILSAENNRRNPITITEEASFNVNGNSIDLDKEMVELSKTGLRFKALSTLARKQFENIRGIIRG